MSVEHKGTTLIPSHGRLREEDLEFKTRAGEMVQRLRALAALPEDLG